MNRRVCAELIDAVWRENLRLKASGLVIGTWGNVSAIDRRRGLVAIKPSGVAYERMRPANIVLTDLDGRPVASRLKPSSDLPTHLALYRAFPTLGGIVHCHSAHATAFAQARRGLPCLGTTHADYFYGEVPVTDPMSRAAVRDAYEAHTGDMIVKKIRQLRIEPLERPAIFVADHGPFAWGPDAAHAVENAIVLEECCRMALFTQALAGRLRPIRSYLLDKHYLRKHGAKAYYGQRPAGPAPAGPADTK